MVNVKNNYQHNYTDLQCPVCEIELDSQEHLITKCCKLSNNITEKEMMTFFGQNDSEMAKFIEKVQKNELQRSKILD